jgi:nucleoside-diphosphate-sugar epimerase
VSEGVRSVCDMTLEHPNKPKVLVTGGTGFLGRAIMKKFMDEQFPGYFTNLNINCRSYRNGVL